MDISTGRLLIDCPDATTRVPSFTFTSTLPVLTPLLATASTRRWFLSTSGVILRFSICTSGTGSNQTVCQIPVTGVYQIPCGLFTCLPLGWYPSSVGSHTFTTTVLFPLTNAGVTSNEKGVYPPVCCPTFVSFTHTSAFQSTAPKCRSTLWFFHFDGPVNSRWYHSSFSLPTLFCTPERLDPTGQGTKISPSKLARFAFPTGKIAYSHNPFRFCHSPRSIMGLGYSGNS